MPSLGKAFTLFLALTANQIDESAAFTPSKSSTSASLRTQSVSPLDANTVSVNDETEPLVRKYGEESRAYRRTVYTHDDWVKHRSSARYFRNLSTLFYSGSTINLYKEVITVTAMATFVVAWNCIFGDYQDLMSVTHAGPFKDSGIPILSLPMAPFTLASPSLGLLLVFRTNTSYKRWDEARKNWGMNINHTRDLVRLGNAYYDRDAVSPERAKEDLNRLALNTWAFVRSMKRHLSPEWEDEEEFKKEMLEKLPKEQAERVFASAHRPNRALQDLSTSIENMPMHFMRRNEIHAAATIFEDNLGSSERLLTSPVPLFYSRHSARFLSFWLLLLPYGMWGPFADSWNHASLIPAMFFLSIFLFGIEELATQLEEPFTILPMQAFCDKIYNWCTEIVSFEPGSNGMPVYKYDNYNMNAEEQKTGILVEPSVAVASVTVEAPTEVEKVVIEEPEPVVEEASVEEPVAEEVVPEEPVAEEAVAEEAATEEVVAEEAATEEVVAEEAVTEEVVAEEAATEEVVAEEADAEEASVSVPEPLVEEDLPEIVEAMNTAVEEDPIEETDEMIKMRETLRALSAEPVKDVEPEPVVEEPVSKRSRLRRFFGRGG